MAYNPAIYNPYSYTSPQSVQAMQMPINGLVRVESIEGAQMYQLPPNSVSPPLFLGSENAFFIKTTDGGGAATLKKYTFQEEVIPVPGNTEFITKEYFDQQINKMMEVINGQHSVPESKPEKQLDPVAGSTTEGTGSI